MILAVGHLKDLLDACAEGLRRGLEPNEHVTAVGRAEDVTARGGIDSGGAAWTFVMVTDQHLRWVPHGRLRYATDVDLDDVTGALERSNAHRWAIRLRHGTVRALRDVPKHRFLTYQWGNIDAVVPLRFTTLAFSRRDTEAARALRDQLARRGIVPRVAAGPPRKPRPDPSFTVLRGVDGH
jgi:hypothetical protein